jgi:hypothetical protein
MDCEANEHTFLTLRWFAGWHGLLAVLVLVSQVLFYLSGVPDHAEQLYLVVLALFHGIYSIWAWKGQSLIPFAKATVVGCSVIGIAYLTCAYFLHSAGNHGNLSATFRTTFLGYALIQGIANLGTAGWMWTRLAAAMLPPSIRQPGMRIEEKNRFIFAIYMVMLGSWILWNTPLFLSTFHLPSTDFSGWRNHSASTMFGPVHLVGIHVLVLAYYNLVAVRYHLTPLVEAGMRGGLLTCIFCLLLVVLRIVHPILLLLPAVDLLSVVWIVISRFWFRTPNHVLTRTQNNQQLRTITKNHVDDSHHLKPHGFRLEILAIQAFEERFIRNSDPKAIGSE